MAAVGYCAPSPSAMTIDFVPASKILHAFGSHVERNHFFFSSAVQVYYVHDDRYGPYNRFKLDGIRLGCNVERPRLVGGHSHQDDYELVDAIVPVPPIIRSIASPGLSWLLRQFDAHWLGLLKELYGRKVRLVWRSRLVEGARFKQSTTDRDYDEELVAAYARLHLPKYIWLHEVSIADTDTELQKVGLGKQKILGEFIFDPTAPPTRINCLSERMLGQLAHYPDRDRLAVDKDKSGEYDYAPYRAGTRSEP